VTALWTLCWRVVGFLFCHDVRASCKGASKQNYSFSVFFPLLSFKFSGGKKTGARLISRLTQFFFMCGITSHSKHVFFFAKSRNRKHAFYVVLLKTAVFLLFFFFYFCFCCLLWLCLGTLAGNSG